MISVYVWSFSMWYLLIYVWSLNIWYLLYVISLFICDLSIYVWSLFMCDISFYVWSLHFCHLFVYMWSHCLYEISLSICDLSIYNWSCCLHPIIVDIWPCCSYLTLSFWCYLIYLPGFLGLHLVNGTNEVNHIKDAVEVIGRAFSILLAKENISDPPTECKDLDSWDYGEVVYE